MNKKSKYFLCILFSILSLTFIINLISAIKYNSSYLATSKVNNNLNSEEIINMGNELEATLNTQITALKEQTSEEYPALGVIYYQTIAHYSSIAVIQNFIFSIIIGFTLGNMIYLFFISEFKSYKLILLLILVLFITGILISLSDIYIAYANNTTNNINLSSIFWNMEILVIQYIVVCLLMLFLKKVYTTYKEIRYS